MSSLRKRKLDSEELVPASKTPKRSPGPIQKKPVMTRSRQAKVLQLKKKWKKTKMWTQFFFQRKFQSAFFLEETKTVLEAGTGTGNESDRVNFPPLGILSHFTLYPRLFYKWKKTVMSPETYEKKLAVHFFAIHWEDYLIFAIFIF